MRLKEFIIFIVIFTVCYILFFIIFDRISLAHSIQKRKKLARSLIKSDQYLLFAQFYGIQGTVSPELIFSIFDGFRTKNENSISKLASFYKVSNYEFIVIVLYLEYLNLLPRKNISLKDDRLYSPSFPDQNMIQKYISFFQNKTPLKEITSTLGSSVSNDLDYIDKQFLVPGVRFVDSQIYYVGDYL